MNFDTAVKIWVVVILALILSMLIVTFASMNLASKAANTINEKYDQLERDINWRKL